MGGILFWGPKGEERYSLGTNGKFNPKNKKFLLKIMKELNIFRTRVNKDTWQWTTNQCGVSWHETELNGI